MWPEHFANVYNPKNGLYRPLEQFSCSVVKNLANSYGYFPPVGAPYPTYYGPSDMIAITNDRAIVIGSAPGVLGLQNTHVAILNLSTVTGEIPCVSDTLFASTAADTPLTIHGHAHDVAATPDGAFAVVSELNWAHVFDLSNGALAASIPLSMDGTQRTPGVAVDSVEVTDNRAIIISSALTGTAFNGLLNYNTWVSIIDLSATPPALMAGSPILMTFDQTPVGWKPYRAHDVAITPEGAFAWVTAWGNVGLFNLSTGTAVPNSQTGTTLDLDPIYGFAQRFYPLFTGYTGQVDSVKCTSQNAIFIGAAVYPDFPGAFTHWVVSAATIDQTSPPTWRWTAQIGRCSVGGQCAEKPWGPQPHDLAISTPGVENGTTKALVSFDNEILILHDISPGAVQSSFEWIDDTGVIVSAVIATTPGSTTDTWTSRSAYFQSGPVLYPYQANNGFVMGLTKVANDGIFLSFPRNQNPAKQFIKTFYWFNTNGYLKPADFALVPGTYDIVVRCTAPPDQTPLDPTTVPNGLDHTLVRPATASAPTPPYSIVQNQSWDGAGTVSTSIDSMVVARNLAVAVGERLPNSAAGPITTLIHFFFTK